MEDRDGYAVYFFPPALEALGVAIKPFLLEGPTGDHVLCRRIDTAGSLIGMHLYGRNATGNVVQVELMVPSNMVRMIVSARSDEAFGFGPRRALNVDDATSPAEQGAEADEAPLQDRPVARKGTRKGIKAKSPAGKGKPANKATPAKARPAKHAQPRPAVVARKPKPRTRTKP